MNNLIPVLVAPLIGALLIFILPANRPYWMRGCALLTSLIVLGLSFALYLPFSLTTADPQFIIQHQWNAELGTSFSLGVDGFSYPLIILTSLLTFLALLISDGINTYQRGYYSLVLILESATLGVFMAQDWALFYVVWELVLIPLFFLIDRWGKKDRQAAALNFVLYTMGGSVFLLLSLLVVFDKTVTHQFTFAAFKLAAQHLSASEQALLLAGFIIGFGVKLPLFPLHGWLPLAYTQAPTPITLLLSGILSKMGAYGLIRAAELFPAGMQLLQPLLMTLGVMGLIYGGLLAWRQTDLKLMLAYSSFSHMGMVMVGIACLNQVGVTGAMLQIIAHALTASALFMLIGLVHRRTHTYSISDYGGLAPIIPRFALVLTLGLGAGIGLPGTAGFIAEVHTMLGSLAYGWGWLLALSVGMVLTATYSFNLIRKLLTGPQASALVTTPDLTRIELSAALILVLGAWWFGFYPAPLLELSASSIDAFAQLFTPVGAH